MENIQEGDKVKHLYDNKYRASLMEIKEVNEDEVICLYDNEVTKIQEEITFNKNDLEVIIKSDGGFF